MPDREKVIEGIEAIREFFGFALPSQMPLFESYQRILTDAISMLKEQEPHVLTRDEMKNMIGESVFVEEPPNNADPKNGWAVVTEGVEPPEEGFNFPGGVDFNAESAWDIYDGDLYGLDKGCGWRAWNKKPTPKQMKDVKWDA